MFKDTIPEWLQFIVALLSILGVYTSIVLIEQAFDSIYRSL
jgi:hypothetical protein